MNLSEQDFITEKPKEHRLHYLKWCLSAILLTVFLLLSKNLYLNYLQQRITQQPFLHVTNRQLSLFLWTYPEYMRAHQKIKIGYLPAFSYLNSVAMEPELADQYAVAPPELFALYHEWYQSFGDVWITRAIYADEFQEFLQAQQEWMPQYWKEAPSYYKDYIDNLASLNSSDRVNIESIPMSVRQAFVGWKNYYKEGMHINEMPLTQSQVDQLIVLYPSYAVYNKVPFSAALRVACWNNNALE